VANDLLSVCCKLTTESDFEDAKKLLPPNAIIGISTSSIEEAKKAVADGADYLGIGTMFATPTYVYQAWISDRY
jgi:thiamine-phosphate diphosphorylase/hydroxyethylthiazole kinase